MTPDFKSVSQDASNRTRVAQSLTLHDGKTLNADNVETWDNRGTGTGLFTGNKYNLSVTSGQYFIRQTKRFANYLSGKSQQVEITFDGFGPQTGVTKRVGYFSSNAVAPFDSAFDGFWLENNGTTITLKVSRSGTETLSVPLEQWSGRASLAEYSTLTNWNNFTVVLFDFLWLGGAVLRMYVKTSNGFVLAHVFNYSGTASDIFMLSPNQPIRYEVRGVSGSGSVRCICSQISTEGSIDESGYNNAGFSLLPRQTVASIGTAYALCGVRKKAAHRDNAVKVTGFDVMLHSINDYIKYSLVLNPTLSAPLTYTAVANSACEFGLAGAETAISITATGGRVLHEGFLSQGQPVPGNVLDRNFLSWLGQTADNTMDEIVLVITPLTASCSVTGALNWKEY